MESVISFVLFLCIFSWSAILGLVSFYILKMGQYIQTTTTTTPRTQLLISNGTSSCDLLCRMGGIEYNPNGINPLTDASAHISHTVPQGPCLGVINNTSNGFTYSCSETPINKAKRPTDIVCACVKVTQKEYLLEKLGIDPALTGTTPTRVNNKW